MKIQQSSLRVKGQPIAGVGSASKTKIKLSQINQNMIGQPLHSALKAKNPQQQTISQHERHVSFDKLGPYHTQGDRFNGIGLAYQSINNENLYDNMQGKVNSLAEEYKQRQQRMDDRLKQEIENNAIAAVPIKNKGAINVKQGISVRKQDASPLHTNDSYINSGGENSSSSKFFRSQRSVAMRIKDNYENQVNKLETDKLSLIQKLNDSLVQLDKLNQEKAQMSEKLIEMLKFVRDMQRETSKGDDLTAVVNDDLRVELRSEKELSHQLKEELKRAEMERLTILSRIHELSQITEEGEVVQSDMNVDLSSKTKTFAQLQEEYKDILDRIRHVEDEIDNLRAITISNQEQIEILRQRIETTVDEKRSLHGKLSQLQERYDTTVDSYSKERHDTDVMQKRHIKLISSNIMFESLSEIHKRNSQLCFNKIRDCAQVNQRQVRSLVKMRKILKQHRIEKLKRYLNLWFTNALQPMKTKKHKYLLSKHLRAKNPLMSAFYQWQCAYERAQSIKHIKRQVIQTMLLSKDDYNIRAVKYCLVKWRDIVRLNEDTKKKSVQKFLLVKHRKSMAPYFAKWRETSQELEAQIKMNGIAQRFAFKKYLSMLFNQWRLVTTDLKVKRVSRLNRAWKNLKVYTMIQKQLRGQTWSILREEKKRQENLVKACFDALRLQKEQEKYQKITRELFDVEIPRKEQAIDIIQKVSQVDTLRYKSQALAAISKCFGKQLFQYFQKWKQFTDHKTLKINDSLKGRALKVYLLHMRNAFTRWIDYKGHRLIQFQSEIIQDQQQDIKAVQNLIVESKNDLNERKQRQQCQSSKQIKKIITNAFDKRVREHFFLWKANLDHKSFIINKLQKVMSRLNRRQRKQAFQRYLAKIKELKQEDAFNKNVEEIRFKLRENMKHRVLNAIKRFSSEYITAKNYMRRLLTRLDISVKDSAFKKWLKFRQYKNEKLLQGTQNNKVEKIKALADYIHGQSDVLEDLVQQNNKLQKNLSNNGRRIIRNAFARFLEQSQQNAFQRWKFIIEKEKRKSSQLRKVILHLMRNTCDYAFRQWKKHRSQVIQQLYTEIIVSEEKQICNIENQIMKNTKVYTNDSDQVGTQLDKVRQRQQEFMIKHQNTLKAMISRVDNQDCISKKRYILQQWFNFVQQRKKCLSLMDKAIKKSLWQQAFIAIKQTANENFQKSRKEAKTLLLIRTYSKVKQRQALRQWRENCIQLVTSIKVDTQKEINHVTRKHQGLVQLVQTRIEVQLIENRKYLNAFDCYVAWKNYVQSEKLIKTKIQTYKDQHLQREKNRTLSKWNKRVQATQKFRHIQSKLDRVYDRNLISDVFQAWQTHNHLNKQFCNSLSSMATILNRVFMLRSFKILKLEADTRSFTIKSNKQRAITKLSECLSQIVAQRKHSTLTLLRQHNVQMKKQSLGQRAIVKYYLLRKIRDYFEEWKRESQKKEVVRFMNEEGPVAVETHKLKKQLYNLKQLAIEDGIVPQEVDKVLHHANQKSIMGIEKSICRLFCYNDDLYLLPQCLDKWKQWVQHRKMFKYWLNYLNKRVDSRTSDIHWAFNKWKEMKNFREKELNGLTKDQLTNLNFNNEGQMHKLDENMQLADDTIQDLTEQRDHLVKRYVGSQRLALAVSNAQYDRTKRKAFSQWISSKAFKVQTELETGLKENLKRITQLKERLKYLEKSNVELADQNEELRQGALDGIEMAKSIDDLTRERENLSIDLADKAIIIRKLLEDNNNLSIRLGNAQEEAQNLIRVSHMKLSKNGDQSVHYANDDY